MLCSKICRTIHSSAQFRIGLDNDYEKINKTLARARGEERDIEITGYNYPFEHPCRKRRGEFPMTEEKITMNRFQKASQIQVILNEFKKRSGNQDFPEKQKIKSS